MFGDDGYHYGVEDGLKVQVEPEFPDWSAGVPYERHETTAEDDELEEEVEDCALSHFDDCEAEIDDERRREQPQT